MIRKTSKILAASTSLLAATAFSGLLAGCQSSGSGSAGSSVNSMDLDKHDCKGQNQCKGHGGCKTADHSCKGQNACKGQGGCNTNNPPK